MADLKKDFSKESDIMAEFDNEQDVDQKSDIMAEFDNEQDVMTEFDALPEPTSEPERRRGEAFAGGAFQDLSLGFLDELKGGLEAGGQMVGVKGLGKEFGEQELQEPVGLDKEKLLDIYRKGRVVERERLAELEKAEPGYYTAGEYSGMAASLVGSAALPKIAQLTGKVGLTKAAKLLAKSAVKELPKTSVKELAKSGAKRGAVIGGAAGLGMGETDLTDLDPEQIKQAAKEMGTGAAIGGTLGTVLPVATKAAAELPNKALRVAKKIGKKLLEFGTDATTEKIERALANPDLLRNPKQYGPILDQLQKDVQTVDKEIDSLNKLSRSVLSTEKDIDSQRYVEFIDDMIDDLGPDRKAANEPLKDFKNYIIKKIGKNDVLSEADLKNLTERIGNKAYSGLKKDTEDVVKKELRELRNFISEDLKEMKGPEFTDLMSNIEDRYHIRDRVKKIIGIEPSKAIDEGDFDKALRRVSQVGQVKYGQELKTVKTLLTKLDDLRDTGVMSDTTRKSLVEQLKDARANLEITHNDPKLYPSKPGFIRSASGPISREIIKSSDKFKLENKKLIAIKKTIDNATKLAKKVAPTAATAIGLSEAADSQASDSKFKNIMNDRKKLEDLMGKLDNINKPSAQNFKQDIKEYTESEDSTEKARIEYNLKQQPAFRRYMDLLKNTEKKN